MRRGFTTAFAVLVAVLCTVLVGVGIVVALSAPPRIADALERMARECGRP